MYKFRWLAERFFKQHHATNNLSMALPCFMADIPTIKRLELDEHLLTAKRHVESLTTYTEMLHCALVDTFEAMHPGFHDYIEDALPHYLHAALWSSTRTTDPNTEDEVDEEYDKSFCIDDFEPDAKILARKDLELFVMMCGPSILQFRGDYVAHRFWLSRNGHGAGFMDYSEEYESEGGTNYASLYRDVAVGFGELNLDDCDGMVYFQ